MIVLLIILVCFILITGFITGNFLFDLALNPKSSKSIIFQNEFDEEKEAIKIENAKWLKENAKDVYIQSNKINLHYQSSSKYHNHLER